MKNKYTNTINSLKIQYKELLKTQSGGMWPFNNPEQKDKIKEILNKTYASTYFIYGIKISKEKQKLNDLIMQFILNENDLGKEDLTDEDKTKLEKNKQKLKQNIEELKYTINQKEIEAQRKPHIKL